MESQYGLQLPYVLGSSLLVVGGWMGYAGSVPSHAGLAWVFVGVVLSSAGATFLCTLPVPLSARWFPMEERTFATAVGAMSLVCGIACAYVLQAAMHSHIPRFLLLNAVLSTTTLPFAPLFRDPVSRNRALGADDAEHGALLARSGGGGTPARKGEKGESLDVLRLNAILWLTDWRVALLLLGSTYILGMGAAWVHARS